MPAFSRIFLVILDGVGVGELPDAQAFGDAGSNTLGHVAAIANSEERDEGSPRLEMETLRSLGIGNIIPLSGIPPAPHPRAYFGKMAELSPGKDTTSGHWEMMGVIRGEPSKTFPHGFPSEMMEQLEETCGTRFLLNKPYSGTEAIRDYGEEHCRTRLPILYTSADSVLQIAVHVELTPLAELYRMCECARAVARGPWLVDRVIARPFTDGIKSLDPVTVDVSMFTRTSDRRDYSIKPPRTFLNHLKDARVKVTGIGKIGDIFAGSGIDESVKTTGNSHGMDETISLARAGAPGFYFINLIDFDSKYGHRNDPAGFACALEEFDDRLRVLLPIFTRDDFLIITADHGNDPTTSSTDHSREYVPLLCYSPRFDGVRAGTEGRSLGVRETFADVGRSVCENWGISDLPIGTSFLGEVVESGEV